MYFGSYIIGSATLQPAQAQIQPDATLGATPSTVRNDVGTGQLLLEGGAPRENTLFHSFSDFNVAPDGNAYFVNPDSITVIVSRVTGNSESNLLGTLGVLGEADLFFINPNGIVFGPESTLDMSGSFFASTADGVVFDDEFTFSSITPEAPPLLTVSTPAGLQFGQQPGPINYQAERSSRSRGLILEPQQMLALLGGELDFQGANLWATGGRIELGSVAEAGFVSLASIGPNWTFNYDDISTFDDLTATSSFIRTNIQDEELVTMENQASGVAVHAADISLSLSTQILANTWTDLSAGNITINAQRLSLESGSVISSRAIAVSAEDIAGNAGDVVINADEEVVLRGGADFGSFISPTGISSDVTGESPFSSVISGAATGDGGDVTINTQRLSVLDGAAILSQTTSVGNAGDITINATESVEVSGLLTTENSFAPGLITTGNFRGTGAGGRLSINTGRLILKDAGSILARTIGQGPGGRIEVNADTVEVLGSAPVPNNPRRNEVRSAITASTRSDGDAGQIIINARRVNIQDGGEITTATLASSRGDGNLLSVRASEDIRIAGISAVDGEPSGLFSSTEGNGSAGLMQIDADELRVEARGVIAAATLSEDAQSSGGLELRVKRLLLNDGELTVETRAQTGSGAEINISNLEVLLLRNNSLISAEAINNANGGNIRIDASEGFVVSPLEEDSDILARANLGNGGDINIVAQSILGLAERPAIRGNGTNDIDASSSFGASGTVLLNELNVNPAVEDVELPDDTRAAEVAQQCNPSQEVSSFVATGRGGVPPEPQAMVPEILWQPGSSQAQGLSSDTEIAAPSQLIEAQGWQTNMAGQIVLTAATTETVPYTTASSMTHCSLTDFS